MCILNLILTAKWSPRLVVVLVNKVIVYTFSLKPQKLHVFETIDNDRGKGQFTKIAHGVLADDIAR